MTAKQIFFLNCELLALGWPGKWAVVGRELGEPGNGPRPGNNGRVTGR